VELSLNEALNKIDRISIPASTELIKTFINTKLSSKRWRLRNLYYVKNKNSKIVKYVPNKAQELVLSKKAKRKIILKARQLGISTERLLYQLDECIFVPNSECGIQSYGQDEARKLTDRVILAWSYLSAEIKELMNISIVAQNSTGITFSNGSKLKIGNFRGDTLGFLHVSELAKIAAKYPEKARELQTGAFEAVSIDNEISIESTAEGKFGLFYEMWKQATRIPEHQRTNLDFTPIFIGWYLDDEYTLDSEVLITLEDRLYFKKLELEAGVTLTIGQMSWYVKKKQTLGKYVTREYPSFAEEAFEAHIEGVYYAKVYHQIKLVRDYVPNGIDYSLPVHVASDIGMNDMFTMGFFQIGANDKPIIIDELSDNEHEIAYYLKLAEALAAERGWTLSKKLVVPHDIKQREFSSGQARYKSIQKLGWKPVITPKLRLVDGIEITRNVLEGTTIDIKCDKILDAITNYRKIWNDKHNVFLDAPVHDNHSHWADMIRYACTAVYLRKIKNFDLTAEQETELYDENELSGAVFNDGFAV